MIAFDLACSCGHLFECWFESAGAYDRQHERGLITCPVCDGGNVRKIPSAFAVKKSGESPAPSGQDVETLHRKLADYISTHFEDVGPSFATEALKIQYGVTEPRNIRGVSTKEEEKMLKEEGVDVLKFPMPAPEKNYDA